MDNKEILCLLGKYDKQIFTDFIMSQIKKALNDDCKYDLQLLENGCIIRSQLVDCSMGEYLEIIVTTSKKDKKNSIVLTKKDYNPFYDIRNGFRQEVSLEVFSTVYSYVLTQDDKVLYSSWYSDDNKYCTVNNHHKLNQTELQNVLSNTSPTYENGVIKQPPKSSYTPFHNIWERYKNTNVFHEYGRNPINGEYSNIGVTFDNRMVDDIKLLSERNGTVFSLNGELNYTDIQIVFDKINSIYQNHSFGDSFDIDSFYEEFNNTMFKSKIKK